MREVTTEIAFTLAMMTCSVLVLGGLTMIVYGILQMI